MRVTGPIRASARNAVNQSKNRANSLQITAKTVFARTSAPAALRLAPTFAAASHQNAPASPPLADTRRPASAVRRFPVHVMNRDPGTRFKRDTGTRITSHQSQVTSSLIYGTGIKKLRKPTPINEYKLLIYGKPRLSHSGLGRSSKSLRPVISCTKAHPAHVLLHFSIDNIGPRHSSGDQSHRPGNSVLQGLNRPNGR